MHDDVEIKALLLLNACYQRIAMDQAVLQRALTEEEKHAIYVATAGDVRRFAQHWGLALAGRAFRD